MCGICGFIGFEDSGLINSMLGTLHHRGSDDEGVYSYTAHDEGYLDVTLGHTRLAIIDLSRAGHQPMSNEDDSIWITYNGEIYNFPSLMKELKDKGHHFKSKTDTEVIIHLYEEHGTKCLDYLNGMFAFALWDGRRGTLFVARDRAGIKPLVYGFFRNRFYFASEIKTILSDKNFPREIDWDALNLFLTFNFIPAPWTIFKHIKKLRPGYFLLVDKKGIQENKYYSAAGKALCPGEKISQKEYEERLFNVLDDAVRIRLISDVPLGAFLSGGLDSSVMVALMARNSLGRVKTFSVGYNDQSLFDETRYARAVSEMYDTEHHEYKLTYRELIEHLPALIESFDEPFADSSALPTYVISMKTRAGVKVAISGDGGDELFAGYRQYLGEKLCSYYLSIPLFLRERVIKPLLFRMPDSRRHFILENMRRVKKFVNGADPAPEKRKLYWAEIFSEELRKEMIIPTNYDHGLPFSLLSILYKELEGDVLNRSLFTDYSFSLSFDMLTKVDWMSMRNSLEVRVPLLDYRVAELAFSMPSDLKLKGLKGKYIFLNTFKHLLPRELHRRPKQGFEMPISDWLRGDLSYLIDEFLSPQSIKGQGIFNPHTVDRMVRVFRRGFTDNSWELWNLLVFQWWYHRYFG